MGVPPISGCEYKLGQINLSQLALTSFVALNWFSKLSELILKFGKIRDKLLTNKNRVKLLKGEGNERTITGQDTEN